MNPTMSHQQINPDTFTRMQNIMGDVFKQLINAYIEQSDQLIVAMPSLLEQQQYAELQRHAHSIKSSSLNIGAEALAMQARQFETLAEQAANDPHTSMAQLQQLIGEIQQAYAALKLQLEDYR